MLDRRTISILLRMKRARDAGEIAGKRETQIGAIFQGAFPAADECGYVSRYLPNAPDGQRRAANTMRGMFVHGYLDAIPHNRVVTDRQGTVLEILP